MREVLSWVGVLSLWAGIIAGIALPIAAGGHWLGWVWGLAAVLVGVTWFSVLRVLVEIHEKLERLAP